MINQQKTKYCELEYQDDWLTIYLDNKDKKNALSSGLIDEIMEILNNVSDSQKVRGILFRGKNEIFCSGADLDELREITYTKESMKKLTINMSNNIGRFLDTIRNLPQITISVIEGPCIAGGFGMACATDVIVTMESSIFRLSETKLGLTPSQIAPYVLNRMAYSKARLLMLLGDEIDGKIAHEIGLADYLAKSESGLQKIIDEIKSKVKQCSPNAMAITKANMSSNQSIDIEKASELFYHCIEHSEGQEGLQSFFEKRKPYWTKDKNKKN